MGRPFFIGYAFGASRRRAMTQQERDDPGLTEMVLDSEPEAKEPEAKREEEFRKPPEGEDELPLTGN